MKTTCRRCMSWFTADDSKQKYCSTECRNLDSADRLMRMGRWGNINKDVRDISIERQEQDDQTWDTFLDWYLTQPMPTPKPRSKRQPISEY